ncbi:MAG: hypothetical protein JNM17_24180 [Archangium sp.]|nr:hypothetical protein [Archangium sp.]
MPTPEPIVVGVVDDTERVAEFFERFAWDGEQPDATTMSAEDFLAALES